MINATGRYRIEKLNSSHVRDEFSCGVEPLDRYLKHQAGQDAKRNTAAIFILTPDSHTVAGFYTLSSQAIPYDDVPVAWQKKLPRSAIPVTLIGRMAVNENFRGERLGEFLLMHALDTAYVAAQTVASWAVIVDSKDGARSFYLKYGFEPLPKAENRLILPMNSITRSIS